MEGKMRKLAAFAIALSMVAAACGGGTPGGGGAVSPTGDQSALAPGKDVKPAANITWWHAMSGINGEALNKIVNNFNASQSAIKVTTVFQGTYDDLLSKLNTALASNAAPALVQVYDIGQRYMYDSGQVVPMQAFIDRDKFDTSDFEPAVLNYYKYQDKLQSMPFNASSSIFYYNKDAFKEVGLDPDKPPVTFSEITDAAKKLTKKDASGATVRWGFGPSIYIMKSRPVEEQQAAWEFVKYAMTPLVQATWQNDTGYYAIRKSAYNEAPAKEWATKYPQFLTAVNQIRESPQNRFTNGAVLGVMPQARARTQKLIESVLLGQATTQAALDAAAAEVNDQIDKYNKANK